MAYQMLIIDTPLSGDQWLEQALFEDTASRENFSKLSNFVQAIGAGMQPCGEFQVKAGVVYATGTFAGSTVVATDTVVIGGFTLTCVNSGATANQFNKGASDTLTMASLATVINAHATLSGWVSASANGTTVTLTAKLPGAMGNAITTTATGGLSAGATRLASGSSGTETSLSVDEY